MRVSQIAVSLLAYAGVTTAFIPWFPPYLCLKEGTCKPEKRSVEAGPAALGVEGNNDGFKFKLIRRKTKSAIARSEIIPRIGLSDPSLPELSDRELVPRATVTAQAPTQSNSASVDQDGGDNSYFAEVLFGSNQTPLLMLLDSGGSQTWVKSSTCSSAACVKHKTFGSANSSSLTPTTEGFSISYGSGSVNGTYATDSISFADLSLRMQIGLASFVSDTFLSFDFDGILGLSQDGNSFLNALVASKQLKSNLFGVSLSSMEDGPNTSEISFGAPDTSKFTGSLSYTAINTTNKGYWTIPLENAGFGNTQMGSLINTPVAYIDTGTTYMFAPEGDAEKFYGLIPGAKPSGGSAWTVPCDTTTPLTFTFSGVTYSIPAKDWVGPMANGVCTSNLYLIPGLGGWLLGDIYLRQVYTVFDVDQSRIGFAPAVIPSSVASSTTSTSTTTGTGITGSTGSMTLSSTSSNATPTGSTSQSQSPGSSSRTTNGHQSTTSTTTPTAATHSAAIRIKTPMTAIMALILITALL